MQAGIKHEAKKEDSKEVSDSSSGHEKAYNKTTGLATAVQFNRHSKKIKNERVK